MHIDRFTVYMFVGLIIGVILHEISHGVVALFFGDQTAKRAGRLTLNPIPHIDPLGSIVLPAMGALSGVPVIGWAKPVPVSPAGLRNPRRDMLAVSFAGPATNLTLALLAAVAGRLIYRPDPNVLFFDDVSPVVQFLVFFASVNVFLGLFNLLPIPPLDGSAIIEPFLPRAWLPSWHRFRPYGMLVLLALVFWTNFQTVLFDPVLERLYEFVLR